MRTAIPARYAGVSLERNPIMGMDRAVIEHVRDFIRNVDERLDSGAGLWFHGDVGTGKTSLAMVVLRAAIDAGRSVAIYSVPGLLAELRNTFDRDSGDSYLELFRRLCAVDVLLLDDLGSEKASDWVLEQLYSVINERWQNQTAVIVTSNNPEPSRAAPARALRDALQSVRRLKADGAGSDRLLAAFGQLEAAAGDLETTGFALDDADPVRLLRERVGWRTVSRLIEICGDPILIMGRDLRIAAQP